MVPLDPGELEDYIMANVPSFLLAMNAVDRDLRLGRTASIEEAITNVEELEELDPA